ncbi:MAG: peptide chain release factor N(5)-glutamine methyltransferase [Eubacteriales bacterium]
MTLDQARRKLRQRLEQTGIAEGGLEASLLLQRVTGLSGAQLLARGGEELPLPQQEQLERLAGRRVAREPLQYILGEWEFMGLPFSLNQDTLIPRADTETLVETLLSHCPADAAWRVWDLCCGSGCIGVSVAHYRPLVQVEMWDISPLAVEAANENARRNGVDRRCRAVLRDVLQSWPEGQVDAILSNPPYIPTGELETLQPEVQWEPRRALDGGEDGMDFYRRMTRLYKEHLVAGGRLYYECGMGQSGQLEKLLKQEGFSRVESVCDLAGIPRVVWGVH